MAMAESHELVEVLKEIRDELRGVRSELGARAARMTTGGIRTEVMDRRARWWSAALAVGGVAGLALVLGLALRDRPARAPAPIAVAPQTPSTPAGSVLPAQAPVVPSAPVAVQATVLARPAEAAPKPAGKQAARLSVGAPTPTAVASLPAPAQKRVKPDVAAKAPAEVASDEDEALALPPPPRRVRSHRLSYGPVESEPAKL
jgi:hypothetical protein